MGILARTVLARVKAKIGLFRDTVVDRALVRPLLAMGFMHYGYFSVQGPDGRLLIEDSQRTSLVNTLFNTSSGNIVIRRGVIFGHNCMVLTGRHSVGVQSFEAVRKYERAGRDIEIGEGTWIASGAIILGNVRIGKFCVVAAGAVVTDDVPDHCLVAGVPARVLRRFVELPAAE